MPQFARPTSTTTLGNYQDQGGGTTNIHLTIDEAAADDADYIRSPTSPTSEVYVCALSSITDPASSTGHIVRVRANKDVASGGEQIDMTVELRQGYVSEASQGTLIATLTQTNLTSTFTTYSLTLSAAQADAITNYASLFLRIVMTKV